MTTDRRPVLVAVAADGSPAALAQGVEEAVRYGCPVQVMHAVDPHVDADGVLDRALRRARELAAGRVHVSSALHHGSAVDGISAASADARLLVIERRKRVPERQRLRGRLISGALSPILCVPEGVSTPAVHATTSTVTVGVHDPLTCGPLIDAALDVAASRGARLRILHVRLTDDDGTAERELTGTLSQPGRHSGCEEATASVVVGRPGLVLIEASTTSDLLVLGRHHAFRPGGSQVGPVARRVLSRSSCPVLLPTPSASVSSAAWVFAGHLE